MFLNFTDGTDYYARKETNQSSLKKILNHPQEYIKSISQDDSLSDKYEKGYLTLGSMVDCLIFEKEKFDQLYISDDNYPPPQELKFINYILEHNKDKDISQELYEKAFEDVGAKKKKVESFIEALEVTYKDYYQNRLSKPDAMFLSQKEIDKANNIANSILTHFLGRKYFVADKYEELECQPVILFEYLGESMRAKLDGIKINHKYKTILPSDLKTSADRPSDFRFNYEKYNYGFQAAFYTLAVKYWMKYIRPELADYTLLPFTFVIQSTVHSTKPLAYEVSQKTLFEKTLEIDQAISLLKYHKEHGFDYRREEIEAGYVLSI